MANRTDPRARQIHGTNPQFLIDKITRIKILNDDYFKQKLFALDAAGLVDRAFELKYIGGTYGLGTTKPSKFLCLLLKMLQIQPSDSIVKEFIANKDFRYVRALGCFYLRMTSNDASEIYTCLEKCLIDYRRLALREEDGKFTIMHFDEFVDHLLTKDTFYGVTLPRMQKRIILEENGVLQVRESLVDEGHDTGKSQDPLEDSYKFEKASSQHSKHSKHSKHRSNSQNSQSSSSSSSSSDSQSSSSHQRFQEKRQRSRSRSPPYTNHKHNQKQEKPQATKASQQSKFDQADPNSEEYWLAMRAKLGI